MKIIISGVAGFIGSNLAQKLLELNSTVIGIDNFSYGEKQNLSGFINHPNFRFIEGDMTDPNLLNDLEGELIIHLASQKIPRYSNALRTLEENSLMLKNVINKCNKDNIRVLFSSTSDIYGKNPNLPYTEESNSVLGPTTVKRWAYALSKIYGEQLILANHAENNLQYTIVRFFGSYGPNQNRTWWGGPQSVFVQNILTNKPIEIHGDGLQTRTFTYVDDTVQGLIKCIFEENAINDIFNIASEPNEEVTIKKLAEIITQMMGKDYEPQLKFIPYSSFGNYEDVRRRVPSIDKIKEKLGYQPQFSLEEGLKRTIEWQCKIFKNHDILSYSDL